MTHSSAYHLVQYLGRNGPTAAGELRSALGLSQTAFSLALNRHRAQVLTVGRARATRYAARRAIPGVPDSFPFYEVGVSENRRLGSLHAVQPKGYYVESDAPIQGFYEDLPWFLHDLRPAGFLGRLVPRQFPELALPADVLLWPTDAVVRYLHAVGDDLVGNLILGEPAFQRFLDATPTNPVERKARIAAYPLLAERAMSWGIAGSSAGGEQPKFLATVEGASVLVKFSPPLRDASSRRVADLLCCEDLALRHLRELGKEAVKSEVLWAGERCFLEVERFDRVGTGRRGLVSLTALAAEKGAPPDDWSEAASELQQEGVIDKGARDAILWLDRFGRWIGNTDRHAGNLSFFFEGGRLGALTPVYDMLPMGYAPRNGELVPFALAPPRPNTLRTGIWVDTWRAAMAFWEKVRPGDAISADFREIAARNMEILKGCEAMLGRLPVE